MNGLADTKMLEATAPPYPLTLPEDEIQLWRLVHTYISESQFARLSQVLAPSEQKRAQDFRFARHRRAFVVARATLRLILGWYLDCAATHIEFACNAYGKPELTGWHARSRLQFNLSHSGDMVMYAMSRNRHVGIDIEQVRSDLEYRRIVQRFFSPYEQAQFRTIPDNDQVHVFFNTWTRKEAYLKARGEGLATRLDIFDVPVSMTAPPMLIAHRIDPMERHRWSFSQLSPGDCFVGTLVVQGMKPWRQQAWDVQPQWFVGS